MKMRFKVEFDLEMVSQKGNSVFRDGFLVGLFQEFGRSVGVCIVQALPIETILAFISSLF